MIYPLFQFLGTALICPFRANPRLPYFCTSFNPGSDKCQTVIRNRSTIEDSLWEKRMGSHHPKRMESRVILWIVARQSCSIGVRACFKKETSCYDLETFTYVDGPDRFR